MTIRFFTNYPVTHTPKPYSGFRPSDHSPLMADVRPVPTQRDFRDFSYSGSLGRTLEKDIRAGRIRNYSLPEVIGTKRFLAPVSGKAEFSFRAGLAGVEPEDHGTGMGSPGDGAVCLYSNEVAKFCVGDLTFGTNVSNDHILPSVTRMWDLGSVAQEWLGVYAQDFFASGDIFTALTPGSVVFIGPLGELDEDNPNFFYDSANTRLRVPEVFGGTAVSDELLLRGSTNANLGLIKGGSPLDFEDVSAANALSPYTVRDASTSSFSGAFVGGTFGDLRVVTFTASTFIWETLRGSPNIQSNTAPGFAAFTLFNALPLLRAGSGATHNPLASLVLNCGPTLQNEFSGTRTTANNFGINFAPNTKSTVSGAVMTVTNITGMTVAPKFHTVAGSTSNLGTIRGVHCQVPGVALFGSQAGTETMTAYIGLDVDALSFGGNVTKVALRSAIDAASNAYFIQNTSNAQSDFGAGLAHWNDGSPIQLGGAPNAADVSIFWNQTTNDLDIFFWSTSDRLKWSSPAADRFLFDTDGGNTVAEYNFNCHKFSLGAQTGAVGNQVGVFVAPTRSVSVGGEWSDFLLTQAGNITLNAAMSAVFGWTINAPSIVLGTGSVTEAGGLRIGGNVNQGTERYGLHVISNPSGGTINRCARFEGAAGVQIDGEVELDGDLNHDGSNVGLYGVAPVAQAADIGALTLTTHSGVPNTTLVDVAGTGDDATINDNLHELGLQINAIRTLLRNLGPMA